MEAVENTFEKHYDYAINEYDIHAWRKERYYVEYTDNVLKAWLPVLDAVYKSWAPRKDPGRRE
jgi:hypothetical protein